MNIYGYDVIGMAYDVRDGAYARPSGIDSLKTPLFDFSNAGTKAETATIDETEYEVPSQLRSIVVYSTGTVTSSEEVKEEEVSESLEVSISGGCNYGIYSGEMSAKYDEEYTATGCYYHCESKAHIERYCLTLSTDSGAPGQEYLSDDAYKDINGGLTAEEVIDKYGTHYIASAVFGGQWLYSRSFSKYHHSTSSSAQGAVQASAEGWRASGSFESSSESTSSSATSSAKTFQVGGDESTLGKGLDEWVETVNGENAVLIGFADGGLVPISELADSETRKEELAAAIDAYFPARGVSGTESIRWDDSKALWVRDDGWSRDDQPSLEIGYETDVNKVIVGIGARVNNATFTRLLVRLMDLDDGSLSKHHEGDGSDSESDYEEWIEVSDSDDGIGHALVGVGLAVDSDNLVNIRLTHQEIDPLFLTGIGLTGDPVEIHSGSEKVEKYVDATEDYRGQVVVGIGMSSGREGVNRLYLRLAALKRSSS